MKGLFTGVVLLFVLGVGGFLYRYTLEHPSRVATNACTAEAKVCPDGTSVARTGSDCAFAACPLPNKELPDVGIAFVIPTGYTENPQAASGDSLVAAFENSSQGTPPHAIVVRRFAIPEGKTANDIMLANTQYESSGELAKSMSEFKTVTIAGRAFQMITVERFEAQVHTLYYLPRANDVLRFEVLERNVTNWTDPNLSLDALPQHAALLRMLGTLQVK